MHLLISDFPLPEGLPSAPDTYYIDLNHKQIKGCTGCFSCWVKTPGRCVIRDDAVTLYPLIAKSKKLIYVSRLYCGMYDEPLKRLLERSIPVQQAFIRLHQGETHHVQRNVEQKSAVIIAYGDTSKEEQNIFQEFVFRNAKNVSFNDWRIRFVKEEEIKDAMHQEVNAWKDC